MAPAPRPERARTSDGGRGMMPRPVTDDQIAAALRAHLPVPHATLLVQIVAEVATTPQQRRLPSIFGRVSDADPMARRRMMLIVALVALALSASAVAIAGALLRQQRAPDLSLEPPTDLPAFVHSTYGWPDTTENAPGVYSWDGSDCSSRF